MTPETQAEPPTTPPLAAHSGVRRWLPTIVLLIVFAVYVGLRPAPAAPEGWSNDFTQATAQASSEHRNLLVAFYMHGCPPCEQMDRTVLPNAKVRNAIADLVPVRVDINKHYDLAQRFGVYATPTYAIARPDGTLLASTMGYHPVDEFVSFLKSAPRGPVAHETASAPTP